ITVNRNAVPFDPRPPMVSSGLRIGTPALATRGFGAVEFAEVADIIATALIAAATKDNLASGETGGASLSDDATVGLRARVSALADQFPLYAHLNDGAEIAAFTELDTAMIGAAQ
ncbi:MAG TPA: serine hydroxymethyltransferase, partial [Arthrobacter bacterium]|nr:serine hydroxymethyltransferase [Arthrobacter sp.]